MPNRWFNHGKMSASLTTGKNPRGLGGAHGFRSMCFFNGCSYNHGVGITVVHKGGRVIGKYRQNRQL